MIISPSFLFCCNKTITLIFGLCKTIPPLWLEMCLLLHADSSYFIQIYSNAYTIINYNLPYAKKKTSTNLCKKKKKNANLTISHTMQIFSLFFLLIATFNSNFLLS